MVGWASRILIAQRSLAALKTDTSAGAQSAVNLIEANMPWFMLGSLGPAIGEFVPYDNPPQAPGGVFSFGGQQRAPYYSVWKELFRFTVGDPSTSLPGMATTLQTLRSGLGALQYVVGAQDVLKLKSLQSSGIFANMNAAGTNLAQIVTALTSQAELKIFQKLIDTAPQIDNALDLIPPDQWTGRDWLHWKRPGDFAEALLTQAQSLNKDFLIAYALGWQVAYASLVSGSGFVNSVVGSSYRTYWWRTRWVSNFIDTWTWGYYGSNAQMGDDGAPKPGYADWTAKLCSAELHNLIDVTNGAFDPLKIAATLVSDTFPLPAGSFPSEFSEFTTFWLSAWNSAYDQPAAPDPANPPLFNEDRLQVGYLMTWLVLWFQTSGAVVGCNVAPSPTPPSACGSNPTPPAWVPVVDPQTGAPYTVSQPNPGTHANVAGIICEILTGFAGAAAAAFAVMPAAMDDLASFLADDVVSVDWNALECWCYWFSEYLYNGVGILHQATVFAGVDFPYPAELANGPTSVSIAQQSFTYTPSAETTCKSRALTSMLQPPLFDLWTSDPIAGNSGTAEAPPTQVWGRGGLWPTAFVDDAASNPATIAIQTIPSTYDPGATLLNVAAAPPPMSFGPAVQNAVALITSSPPAFPNWNLDCDRGLGWLTWEFTAPYSSPVTQIKQEP
jgi:hypothetical protein